MPLIIGALGGGMRQVAKDVGMIFENNDVTKKTICEMQKTVLMDSEITARKVLSGLIQEINEQIYRSTKIYFIAFNSILVCYFKFTLSLRCDSLWLAICY